MSPKGIGKKDQKSNKRSRYNEPRMLALVIEAVSDLKQTHGSTTNDIITHLKSNLRTFPRKGNFTRRLVEVRRALRNGVIVVLLEQRSGRYFISTKDSKSNESTKERNSDKNRNRLHSRTKSQSLTTQGLALSHFGISNRECNDSDDCASSSATKSESSPHSRQRGGKRKKHEDKNKQKRERTKRRRKSASSVRSNSAPSSGQKKKSQPLPDSSNQQKDNEMPSTSNYLRRHKRVEKPINDVRYVKINKNVKGNDQNTDGKGTCGNPDCLCNVLPEHQQPSREPKSVPACNTEKTHDYIN